MVIIGIALVTIPTVAAVVARYNEDVRINVHLLSVVLLAIVAVGLFFVLSIDDTTDEAETALIMAIKDEGTAVARMTALTTFLQAKQDYVRVLITAISLCGIGLSIVSMAVGYLLQPKPQPNDLSEPMMRLLESVNGDGRIKRLEDAVQVLGLEQEAKEHNDDGRGSGGTRRQGGDANPSSAA